MDDSPKARWLAFALILGAYLSTAGYQSREGDQAYRLPLLLHRQDPSLYANDPFVKAFDAFNPHRGYLALLDGPTHLIGLSGALVVLYVLTFALTACGFERLSRSAWPEVGPGVGLLAVTLLLVTKAGNIGTNHLFEGMLLDRLIGFGLGWVALAAAVADDRRAWWIAPTAIGLAALIHPSVGLQLAMLLGTGWIAWAILPTRTGVRWRDAGVGVAGLILALVPALILHGGGGSGMLRGLSREEYLLLAAYVQSPQHMIPHLWRRLQWLAWAGMLALAALTLLERRLRPGRQSRGSGMARLAILLGVNLLGLGMAWVGIEVFRDLWMTLFQPFRMATIARGLALAILAGHIRQLWCRGDVEGQVRAALLVVALAGDWSLVVVAMVELSTTAAGWVRPTLARYVGIAALVIGLVFLTRHDTESGHWPLIGAVTIASCRVAIANFLIRAKAGTVGRDQRTGWTPRRLAAAMVAAWMFPLAAWLAPIALEDRGIGRRVVQSLAGRCRFGEIAIDDVERLGLWCRANTPKDARFVGPPGPKGFRLWSRREVAFNRAASPYHAAGLADWSARFRDHVGFRGTTAEFARAYLADRHGLEARYQAMTDAGKAALAARQGATYVLAAAPKSGAKDDPDSRLELVRIEGRHAVYRVRPPGPVSGADGLGEVGGDGVVAAEVGDLLAELRGPGVVVGVGQDLDDP